MDSVRSQIAARLNSVIEARELHVTEFCALLEPLGVESSRRTVENYLREITDPSAVWLTAAAHALGVNAAWLLTGVGDKHRAKARSAVMGELDWADSTLVGRLEHSAWQLLLTRDWVLSHSLPEHRSLGSADEHRSAERAAADMTEYLRASLLSALRASGLGFDPSMQLDELVSVARSRGWISSLNDAVTLMVLALESVTTGLRTVSVRNSLAEAGLDGVLLPDVRDASTFAARASLQRPSVAPSVATRNTKTAKDRKQPKSKKGQPRG